MREDLRERITSSMACRRLVHQVLALADEKDPVDAINDLEAVLAILKDENGG